MHTPLRSFPSTGAALAFWRVGGGDAGERAAVESALEGERVVGLPSTTQLLLSSETDWRFLLAPTPQQAPRGFQEPSFDDGSWSSLPVPANWQLHGFDTPIYSNIVYPFACDPPRAERRGTW